MENLEQQRETEKGHLNLTEQGIAKMLMESRVYDTLTPKERLELIKFLEEKYPALAKEFDPDHIDA